MIWSVGEWVVLVTQVTGQQVDGKGAPGRRFAGVRARRRGWLTRERVGDFARTMAWVAPLTLLIWIWAEREQLATTPNPVVIPVSLRTSNPNLSIRVTDPPEKNVLAQLTGPKRALDEVLQIISRPGENNRVTIAIDPTTPLGGRTIGTERIGQDPLFAMRGITVVNTSPSNIAYQVDKIVEAEVPVVLAPGVTNLDGPARFEPATVTFRGPQAVLDRLSADKQLAAQADIGGRDSLRVPGAHEEKDVRLILPAVNDPDASFKPTKVTASFTVRQANERYLAPYLSVWVMAPPNLAEKGYRAVLTGAPNLTNVTLLATPDLIEALRNDTIKPKPKAHIEVSLDDLPANTPRTREVKFDLPEGVSVAPEDAKRTVEFRLQEISPRE